jgi:bifunctional pyridoxal-dependent enzyme with beta-cystathionase and maltose regulon repressor activities
MSWEMFGYPKGDGEWLVISDRRTVKMHGCANPVPVLVVEDPEGTYLGWMNETQGSPPNNGVPEMIMYKTIFNIQFAYGYEAEEAAGHGRAIPLTIKEIS